MRLSTPQIISLPPHDMSLSTPLLHLSYRYNLLHLWFYITHVGKHRKITQKYTQYILKYLIVYGNLKGLIQKYAEEIDADAELPRNRGLSRC